MVPGSRPCNAESEIALAMEYVQVLKASKRKSGDSHENHDRYRQQPAGSMCWLCMEMQVLLNLATTGRIRDDDALSSLRLESVGRLRASYCWTARTASVDEWNSSCILVVAVAGNRTKAGRCQM